MARCSYRSPPFASAALVVPLIAERLGASGDNAAAIATRIGEKRTHVVLDNLEQLLPDAARPLAELLACRPGSSDRGNEPRAAADSR